MLKIGLYNIGNTCYMNSALQCLFNCRQLVEYFNQNKHLKETNPKYSGLSDEFGKLVQKMSQKNKTQPERPQELKQKIEKISPQFRGSGQQDSQEFLRTLLEALNDDLNRIQGKKPYKELEADIKKQTLQQISDTWFQYYKDRDNSIITDLFTGQLLSVVSCQKCNNPSIAFDNFMDLSLSFSNSFRIKTDYTLESLIQTFLKDELLDYTYHCSNCKDQKKSKRQFHIWKLPNILVLHIKRFHFGSTRREKLNHNLIFPIQGLDMGQFITKSKDKTNNNCIYDLFGVVNHMGSLYGGHYYAECKNPFDGTWNEFNDSSCREIDIQSKGYTTMGAAEPYLLFYCKRQDFDTE